MARDVLSIPSTSFKYRWQFYSSRDTPVTSVDTERAFKAGKNTISDNRHSLADKTIRASILFGDWSKQEGLLSEDILLRYTARCVNDRKSSLGATTPSGPDEGTRSGCFHNQI